MFCSSRRHIVFQPVEKWSPMFLRDCDPSFRFVSYSYASDTEKRFSYFDSDEHFELGDTEGLGHTFFLLCKLAASKKLDFDMVTIINGDVMYKFSDLEAMFHYADRLALNWFQPALSIDSYFSHDFTLVQPGRLSHAGVFVELMCFTLPMAAIKFIAELGIYSQSGWGMDWHLIPYSLKQVMPQANNAPTIIDLCQIAHLNPLEAGREKIYPNGLTAYEELQSLKASIEKLEK